MKRSILILGVVAGVALTSCSKSEVCGCVDTSIDMMQAIIDAETEEEMKEAEEKYSEDTKACEKIMKPEDEKAKEKIKKEAEECDNYSKIEELAPKMLEKMLGGLGKSE